MNDLIVRSFMAYRRKSNYRRRAPKRRPAKRMPRKAAVKRIVRREISRNQEVKTKQSFVSNVQLFPTTAASFASNVIQVGPNSANLVVSQGTGQGNRVGNQIITKRLVFSGRLTPQGWDTTLNPNPRPLAVKMLVLYDREDDNTAPVPGSTFFQDGNTTVGFAGTLMDMVKPINADRFRILAQRTFKLGFAAYTGTATTPANQSQWQAYTNNDFKLNCEFRLDLTKYYPKRVKFNDTTSDPTTRGLWVFFYYIDATGAVIPSTQVNALVHYMQDYKYTDA